MISFIKERELTVYEVKYHPNSTANTDRSGDMVDAYEFTKKVDFPLEFNMLPRPEKFFVIADQISGDSRIFVKEEAIARLGIQQMLPPSTADATTDHKPSMLEELGMRTMQQMIMGNLGNSRRAPFDLTGAPLAGYPGAHLPERFDAIPSTQYRSEKDRANDAALERVKPLYSLDSYNNLFGEEQHANLFIARSRLSAALCPEVMFESGTLPVAIFSSLVSFTFVEYGLTEMIVAPDKIENQKQLDDLFFFMGIVYGQFGSEYHAIIQAVQQSANYIMRRFPAILAPEIVKLMNKNFAILSLASQANQLGKHPRPSSANLRCDPRIVADILTLKADSTLTRLMVEKANLRVADDLAKRVSALSTGRDRQPTKDTTASGRSQRSKGGPSTIIPPTPSPNNRGGGAAGSGGGSTRGNGGPPHIAGGPYCYYQYKAGRPCFGQTICQNTPPRVHGFPHGTDQAAQTAFIAWVQANIT